MGSDVNKNSLNIFLTLWLLAEVSFAALGSGAEFWKAALHFTCFCNRAAISRLPVQTKWTAYGLLFRAESLFNPSPSRPHVVSLWAPAPIMAVSFWYPLLTQISALKARLSFCQQRREKARERVMGILSCPFWLIFVLILVQIHSVWLCSCRLRVSWGPPWEAGMIHSLLSLSVSLPVLLFYYHVSDVDSLFDSVILECVCF